MGVELLSGSEASFAGEYRTEVVQEAGHFVHLEKPDTVNALIEAWLDGDRR